MIKLFTELDSGIYASCGGGKVVLHQKWRTNATNIRRAINRLKKHRANMREYYGNIGCGYSWLEIDGHELTEYEEYEYEQLYRFE